MKAIRRFNNNVVLCVDDNGQEVIVFGKGVGFHELPYEVELNVIEKTYYGIENRYMKMLKELKPETIELARQILDLCRCSLIGDINPNMLFTMADHIEFMMERKQKNIKVNMPLYYDFENLHPVEFQISKKALRMIEQKFQTKFDKCEIVGIGMNILNAELNSDANLVNYDTNQIIEEITKIIEKEFGITIERESGNYARYVSHMQYLMERISTRSINLNYSEKLYRGIKEEYPKADETANRISDYLIRTKRYKLNQDELLYLILHINRLCSREECYR